MSDLIERQKAIDAPFKKFDMGAGVTWIPLEYIEQLPSAQLENEERKEESAQNVPKEDLISRKEAIEAMSESLKRVFPEHRQIAEKCLKALPSAQHEPQWIHVSESLPEEGQSILVTADGWRMVAIIRTFFKDMHKDIIAWMPLPEPYRAERRTDGRD